MIYDPRKIGGTNHKDLESLHPIVAILAKKFIENANQYLSSKGLVVKVISTLRTWEEQKAVYAQGRTKPGPIVSNAPAGKSIHNWGCAFDVGIFKNGEYLDGAFKKDVKGNVIPDYIKQNLAENTHKEISQIGKKLGLFWGGDFINKKDYPHYQFTGDYDNNKFLQLANSGESVDDILDPTGELINKIK